MRRFIPVVIAAIVFLGASAPSAVGDPSSAPGLPSAPPAPGGEGAVCSPGGEDAPPGPLGVFVGPPGAISHVRFVSIPPCP